MEVTSFATYRFHYALNPIVFCQRNSRQLQFAN